MVFTSTTPWKPTNVKIFQNVWNWRNWILSIPRLSVCREKKSPWLRQYQSYISNWYVNGKVFTSTRYNMGTKKFDFFLQKSSKLNSYLYFDLCWRAEIIQVGLNMHLYVDIGDASSSLWGLTSSHLKQTSWQSMHKWRSFRTSKFNLMLPGLKFFQVHKHTKIQFL